jgi:parallel beta-helix repeat protein
VIKPRTSGTELFVDGTLIANGTADNRIYVTSLKDDSIGGQTNNNANAPAPRNWGQLYFRENSSGSLNFVDVRYGGGASGSAGIHILNSSPSITNSRITKNPRGISIEGPNSNPTINNCDIYGNSDYGMYNSEAGHWITATNNYWGGISGPYDPSPPGVDGSYNYGSGDRVNDYINYRPWISIADESIFIPIVFNKP